LPDLRRNSTLSEDAWFDIALKGDLQSQGMVSFSKELSGQDAAASAPT